MSPNHTIYVINRRAEGIRDNVYMLKFYSVAVKKF